MMTLRVATYTRVSTVSTCYNANKLPRAALTAGEWRNLLRRLRAEHITTSQRECTRCHMSKQETLEFFKSDKRYAKGLTRWCRVCLRDYARSLREKNPEKERKRHRRAYAANPEKRREAVRRSYEKHAEKRRAERRAYGKAHRQKELATGLIWRARNPLRLKNYTGRQRAKKYGVEIGEVDLQVILNDYGWTCHICGECIDSLGTLTFDHVIPLSLGGNHTQDNLKPAHYVCNRMKNGKIIS